MLTITPHVSELKTFFGDLRGIGAAQSRGPPWITEEKGIAARGHNVNTDSADDYGRERGEREREGGGRKKEAYLGITARRRRRRERQ
ncbi:hypothetical protein AXF42_Ash018416 [Apostasia shenzhenica]|uniref:Uncharacterized protein n=1 Tax=Apostasia shenzhenica TaxID=1088818 RepID=A0A2I0BEE1_9ASPA|nr:hypothetical protein AXF42_Ash018416 [Apostasia shenzhenica]